MTQAMTTPSQLAPTLLQKQHQWPLIARDIALMSQPNSSSVYSAGDIATMYQLSLDEFADLCKLPVFVDMVKAEVARLKELGPFAGHRLRAESMASDIQERLYLESQNGMMETKTSLKFLELLLRSAGLDEPQEKKDPNAVGVGVGVNVTFNIPQLPSNPKLQHLVGSRSARVIDVEGTVDG